jgi:hypothetical protein
MAIQQSVNVTLTLIGDGSSTAFTYAFNRLFELIIDSGAELVSPATVPSSAVVGQINGFTNSGTPSAVASLDGFGNLVITFSAALANGDIGTVGVQLLFNSGTLAGTTQAWTSATAVNSTWTLPLNGLTAVQVGFVMSGTVSAGTILFEVSQDGTNFFPIQGAISNGFTALTGWTPGVGNLPVSLDVSGFAYFRLALSSAITGTGTVTFVIQGNSSTNEPTPVVGQANGTNLHVTLDDAAGGNAVNTVVKGTQAARALGVQDLKDSGRTPIVLYLDSIAGVTTEALATMNINKGGTTSTATEYTVTAGKTLRVQSMYMSVRASSAAMVSARARLRSAATVSATSPVFCLAEASSLSATTAAANGMDVSIPDGLEFAGGVQVGVSQIATATTADVTVLIVGYEY